jgi:hypothetical protein
MVAETRSYMISSMRSTYNFGVINSVVPKLKSTNQGKGGNVVSQIGNHFDSLSFQ